MFYIFNKDNVCIASCSFEPNLEDLESRCEFCVESTEKASVGYIFDNGLIVQNKADVIINYEAKARFYRNTLRNQLDEYLKPASTIDDKLVTEDQKATLIKDSLLLAGWPATVGWPYIPLPELSDTALDILGNPMWEV